MSAQGAERVSVWMKQATRGRSGTVMVSRRSIGVTAVFLFLLLSQFGSMGGSPAAAEDDPSPPSGPVVFNLSDAAGCKFEGRLPLPDGESGLLGSVSFNAETCEIVAVEYLELSRAEFDALPANSSASSASDPIANNLSHDGSGGGSGSCHTKRTNQWIEDPIDLKLTGVNTRLDWCYSGLNGVITSYNGTGGVAYHREEGPFGVCGFAGCGWGLRENSLTVPNGGVNQSWVGLRGQARFVYKGYFDPTGSAYENYHSSTLVANTYGSGTWWCVLSVTMKTRPPGIWEWKPYCGA